MADSPLEIACPNCGQKHAVGIAQLQRDSEFEITCPCGLHIPVRNDGPKVLQDFEKAFEESLKRAFKGSKAIKPR